MAVIAYVIDFVMSNVYKLFIGQRVGFDRQKTGEGNEIGQINHPSSTKSNLKIRFFPKISIIHLPKNQNKFIFERR